MTSPTPQPHNRRRPSEDEEDPVDHMIVKTGCAQLHYAVQDCMAENQDWRKCQPQVQTFKNCMVAYQKTKREELTKHRQKLPQTQS
ncbi:hypothetical protein AOXY_G11018 [Acipenser oxyrinchus oxyrinchus]|uniref:Cytochrome c oxidase assembly factor 4 homolog n=1 Tax=Acipenser oxyrinchus oxyrinchus TaxID=40147 RepID=A0AAD8DFM3_ACIOX|nr:hypothetical protein AOXY_G11018 [Acipenser oxyrinchus oxyrinchus]